MNIFMFFKGKRHSQYKSITAKVPNKKLMYEFPHVYFVDLLHGDDSFIKIFTLGAPG